MIARKGALIAAGALALGALAGCSSGDEAATETVSPTPTMSTPAETIEEEPLPIEGCGAYFEFDLIRSQIAAGTKDLSKKQSRALLVEYKASADAMVADIDVSVVAGDLPAPALKNAERIATNLSKVKPKTGVKGISAKQQSRIDNSAARIETACAAAGDLLPEENLTAREGAGA